MISLRYHVVSIAAVFLALALGVVLGASGVSDRLLSSVTTRNDDLSAQVATLTVERDDLAAAQRASDEFAGRVGPAAVTGLLAGQTVAIVSAGADPGDRAAVGELIGATGATVTGDVVLTDAVGDPARGDQLRELIASLLPTGAQLPAASDTGSLLGGLLGGAILAGEGQVTPEQAGGVLLGLQSVGFVEPGQVPGPASLVLVLTGGEGEGVDAADQAGVVARLAAQLDRGAAGVVLAGRTGSAEARGAVGVARADPTVAAVLSTVDDVQSGPGRVSTVLALAEQLDGGSGSYGIAETATGGSAPGA